MNPAPPATIIQYAGDEFFIATTPSGHAIAVDVKGGRRAAPGPLELFITGLGSCTAAANKSPRTMSRFGLSAAKNTRALSYASISST